MFNPQAWAARYNAAIEECWRNSHMDSGWSAAVAERTAAAVATLMSELLIELRKVKPDPSDPFDRPELAAVLIAVNAPAAFDISSKPICTT